jgi:RNA polymerase sigma-32 factor
LVGAAPAASVAPAPPTFEPRQEELRRKDRAGLLATYLGDVRRHRVMSREEEHEVAVRYHETGERRLAERLVTANLRLVLKIALEYKSMRRQLGDMVQEGNLGLLHAVEKFDPHRGVKLSSYAAWWIRAYILKFILANSRLVKLGTTQAQRRLFFGLRRVKAQLAGGGSGEVPKSQLAASFSVSEKEIDEMELRLASPESSLDWPTHAGDDRPMQECLQFSGMGPDAEAEAAELQAVLGREIAAFGRSLKGRDQVIFTKRLLCEEAMTLADIAKDFGVSRERVRQIEQRLKDRLRKRLRAKVGDPFTGEGPVPARPPLRGKPSGDLVPAG